MEYLLKLALTVGKFIMKYEKMTYSAKKKKPKKITSKETIPQSFYQTQDTL